MWLLELGGEDAKIIYFDGGIDQRMNGTCAGGTGAFIDQMASLLQTDAQDLMNLQKTIKLYIPLQLDVEFLQKLIFNPY